MSLMMQMQNRMGMANRQSDLSLGQANGMQSARVNAGNVMGPSLAEVFRLLSNAQGAPGRILQTQWTSDHVVWELAVVWQTKSNVPFWRLCNKNCNDIQNIVWKGETRDVAEVHRQTVSLSQSH